MDMIRLENIEYLYALLLIPLFILIYFLIRRSRLNALKKFGNPLLVSGLHPDVSKYKATIKFILRMFAVAFLVFAIANPQIGSKLIEVKREGVDVVIALDVSNSMLAEDIKPNRLERAKRAISKLIDNLKGDRIGLIVFAGSAYIQLPMTSDYSAAKLFLHTIDTDIVSVQGTAIGAAIELAIDKFKTDGDKRKALIIITDGENHEDDAYAMAGEAEENGFVVYTIGMGTVQGGPIPIYRNGQRTGFLKDEQDETVISKLDASILQEVALAGNGKFIRSGENDPNLSELLVEISEMDKTEFESKRFADYEDRFQYLLAAAFIFLLIEVLLSSKKNKYIASMNLFRENR